ncbi:MAG: trigger factor [Deltaproteobacteria bacterium]|nr:trigger factor [Deltaproteobacteria bacterium]
MDSLNITVEKLEDLKVKLKVSVPPEKVKTAYDNAYRAIKDKVNVPGFRKGKTPKSMIEKRFQSHMRQEALEKLVPEYYQKAIKQEDIKAASQPEIDNLEIEQSKPFVFTATLEVWADFEIPDPKVFKLEKKEVQVTEEDISLQKQKHLDAAADYIKKSKQAKDGDKVIIDFDGKTEDGPVGKDENFAYILGSKQLLPEVEAHLLGMKAGEEKTFEISLPADHQQKKLQGKKAEFWLKVNEVQEKKTPEFTPEFFKKFGEDIKTEADFEKFVLDELTELKELEIKNGHRDQIKQTLEKILVFPLPSAPLREEIEFQVKNAKSNPRSKEIKDEDIQAEAESRAEHLIRLALLIDKVVDREKLKVQEEEVYRRFNVSAQIMGINPKELLSNEYGKRFLEDSYQMVKEETVLDFITQQALKS